MKSLTFAAVAAVMCQSPARAFSFSEMEGQRLSALRMSSMSVEGDSRREFFTKSASTIGGLGLGVLAPSPALAVGGVDRVNAKLKS